MVGVVMVRTGCEDGCDGGPETLLRGPDDPGWLDLLPVLVRELLVACWVL